MEKIDVYKRLIDTSIENAEKGISKITQKIIEMDGMSGLKTRHFYNNLLNLEDARYLEIGSWKGSSVCSAMCENKADVICIDNCSFCNFPRAEFLSNFQEFKGKNRATFIESDCFNLDKSKLPRFNIYLYDGEHEVEDHKKALTYYYECLDDIFIFIVDDWNWSKVREGTIQGIEQLKLKVLYEREFFSDYPDSKGWWNGIYICILQK